MNVQQLIDILKDKCPTDLVVISGYEGGLDEVDYVKNIKIAMNVNDSPYFGDHERTDDCNGVNGLELS